MNRILSSINFVIKKRVSLIIGVSLLVLTLSTATIWAAIPSSTGTVDACYNNITRTLRAVDVEAGQACNILETAISWPSEQAEGAQSAYVYLNSDASLNTTGSKNVNDVLLSIDGSIQTFCFNLAFVPKWSDINFSTAKASVRGAPGHASIIDSQCGSEYEAAFRGVVSEPYDRVGFAFFD